MVPYISIHLDPSEVKVTEGLLVGGAETGREEKMREVDRGKERKY